MYVHTFVHHTLNQYSEKVRCFDINTQLVCYQGVGMGLPANAGTAGGWVLGAGKCRGIVIWVPANAGLLT